MLQSSWLLLVLAGCFGAGLAMLDQFTAERIANNKRDRLYQAGLQVVPNGTHCEPVDIGDQRFLKVLDADGDHVGWAVNAKSVGFQDKIELLIGLSKDVERITGLAVLESRETPGLGERIRENDFLSQFAGKSTDAGVALNESHTLADESIQGITGATISSRAVTRAVNDRLARISELIQQETAP